MPHGILSPKEFTLLKANATPEVAAKVGLTVEALKARIAQVIAGSRDQGLPYKLQ